MKNKWNLQPVVILTSIFYIIIRIFLLYITDVYWIKLFNFYFSQSIAGPLIAIVVTPILFILNSLLTGIIVSRVLRKQEFNNVIIYFLLLVSIGFDLIYMKYFGWKQIPYIALTALVLNIIFTFIIFRKSIKKVNQN